MTGAAPQPVALELTVGAASVAARAGEIVALVGHDGAPGRIARRAAQRLAAEGVGYVPAGRPVFGSLTVTENLIVGAYRDRRDKRAVAARLAGVHERFPRLAERARQPAGTLSGGEQQLLMIARALMGAPRALILEDPSAGLGPPAIEAVARALEQTRAAVVIADEGLALARAAAHRIVLVEGETIALDAPAAQALADERLGLGYITGSSSTA